jgi:hypothetical protein
LRGARGDHRSTSVYGWTLGEGDTPPTTPADVADAALVAVLVLIVVLPVEAMPCGTARRVQPAAPVAAGPQLTGPFPSTPTRTAMYRLPVGTPTTSCRVTVPSEVPVEATVPLVVPVDVVVGYARTVS